VGAVQQKAGLAAFSLHNGRETKKRKPERGKRRGSYMVELYATYTRLKTRGPIHKRYFKFYLKIIVTFL